MTAVASVEGVAELRPASVATRGIEVRFRDWFV